MNYPIPAPGAKRRTGGIASVLAASLAAMVLFLAAFPAKPADAQSGCGSIQSRVDATSPGATVDLPDGCIYRETVTVKKPLTLEGGPGVEIRGSDVWASSEFSAQANGTWRSSNAVTAFADGGGPCDPSFPNCQLREQVFYDGEPLEQVADGGTPGPGQFSIDANNRVVVGSEPTGKTVEVTMRSSWVNVRSQGVTVKNFRMSHSADDGIDNNTFDNIVVDGGDYSYAHVAAFRFHLASGVAVKNAHVHHNGLVGIAGSNARWTITGNEVDYNGIGGFLATWGSGGMKLPAALSATVSGNVVHHNIKNGIWFDGDVDNPGPNAQIIEIFDNRSYQNHGHGVKCEITLSCHIYNNVIYENGWESGGSGITANGSSFGTIHDNIIAWNADGISIANPLRTDVHPDQGYYDLVREMRVHHNTILQEDGNNGFGLSWTKSNANGNIYDKAAGNRGYENRYWYPTPKGFNHRFLWKTKLEKLGTFNRTRGEERGRYLSDVQKDAVVAAKGIPAFPEH
jgi:hypothetical protein